MTSSLSAHSWNTVGSNSSLSSTRASVFSRSSPRAGSMEVILSGTTWNISWVVWDGHTHTKTFHLYWQTMNTLWLWAIVSSCFKCGAESDRLHQWMWHLMTTPSINLDQIISIILIEQYLIVSFQHFLIDQLVTVLFCKTHPSMMSE